MTMKVILRFTDSRDKMDIEDFSEEKRKEILKKSIGETIFIEEKHQWYVIDWIERNSQFDVREIWLSPTLRLFKKGDKVKVIKVGNPEHAKYYNSTGEVIKIRIPPKAIEKRKQEQFTFHYIAVVKLNNGHIISFFDTELELI